MLYEVITLQEAFNGAFSMWIFAGLNVFCLYFLTRYVPETKGVALEDIEDLLANHMQHLARGTKATLPQQTMTNNVNVKR